jgi:rubredoxin
MSLFECKNCGCVANTATDNFGTLDDNKVCSECETGKWHGQFDKHSAKGMHVDQKGGLWSTDQIQGGALPAHYKIVRIIE